jgi:hypothetical protein
MFNNQFHQSDNMTENMQTTGNIFCLAKWQICWNSKHGTITSSKILNKTGTGYTNLYSAGTRFESPPGYRSLYIRNGRNNKWSQVDERWEAGGQCQVCENRATYPSNTGVWNRAFFLHTFTYSLIITSSLIREYKTYVAETASLTFPNSDECKKQMSSFAYKPKFHDRWTSHKIDKHFSLNFREVAGEYILIIIITKKNELI